jgi:hypothetical protein
MPIHRLNRNCDFDHAASLALWGKLGAAPAVSEAHCEAYLLTFTETVADEHDSSKDYRYGLLMVTRGHLGGYASAMTVVAADADGEPLVDDETESGAPIWTVLDSQAQLDEVPVEDYLRRAKLPI